MEISRDAGSIPAASIFPPEGGKIEQESSGTGEQVKDREDESGQSTCSPAVTCSTDLLLRFFLRVSHMTFMFEKLEVYQKAVSFADKVDAGVSARLRIPGRPTQSRGALDCDQSGRGQRPFHQAGPQKLL